MKLYTDTANLELDHQTYEPCTQFCEVEFELPKVGESVDAVVTMTQDDVTPGGRPRMRLVVKKKD